MSNQEFPYETPKQKKTDFVCRTPESNMSLNKEPGAPRKLRLKERCHTPLKGPKSLRNEFEDVSKSTLKYWAAIAIVIIITIILSTQSV